MANKRLKSLAMWNLRSTRSALKDVEEMLQVIEDLYGEESFEEEPPKQMKTNIKSKQMNTLVEACQNAIAILGLQWSVGKIWDHVRR